MRGVKNILRHFSAFPDVVSTETLHREFFMEKNVKNNNNKKLIEFYWWKSIV